MRLELGADVTQGRAQRAGVTMSIMTSWVAHSSQGRPLSACSDPDSAVLCPTQLAQIPHPAHGLLLAPLPGHGCVVPP